MPPDFTPGTRSSRLSYPASDSSSDAGTPPLTTAPTPALATQLRAALVCRQHDAVRGPLGPQDPATWSYNTAPAPTWVWLRPYPGSDSAADPRSDSPPVGDSGHDYFSDSRSRFDPTSCYISDSGSESRADTSSDSCPYSNSGSGADGIEHLHGIHHNGVEPHGATHARAAATTSPSSSHPIRCTTLELDVAQAGPWKCRYNGTRLQAPLGLHLLRGRLFVQGLSQRALLPVLLLVSPGSCTV